MTSTLDPLSKLAARYAGGIDAAATQGQGFNSTLITSTTPVAIVAAPGAGKKLLITRVTLRNATPAEAPIITLQDNAGTPVELDAFAVSTAAGNGGVETREYHPPLEVAENKALHGKSDASTGDTRVFAQYYTVDV